MTDYAAENSIWIQRLRSAARRGAISHAVILSGTGDIVRAAGYLAAAQLCPAEEKPCLSCNVCRKVLSGIHPDVITVQDADHRELTVDTIRSIRQDVYIRPNEAERKVYLFTDCSQLNERDQNVLLKIVEEGPPYAAFIFCTNASHTLLPTVRSRCIFMDLREDFAQAFPPESAELCRVIGTSDPTALMSHIVSLENRKLKREGLQALLQGAWEICAEVLLQRSGKPQSEEIREYAALLQGLSDRRLQRVSAFLAHYTKECNYNVGVGQILGALLCDLSDQEVKP